MKLKLISNPRFVSIYLLFLLLIPACNQDQPGEGGGSDSSQAEPRKENFSRVVRRIPLSIEEGEVNSAFYLSIDEESLGLPVSKLALETSNTVSDPAYTLVQLIKAIQSKDKERYNELHVSDKRDTQNDFYEILITVIPEGFDAVVHHCFAFGEYRYYFVGTSNEQFSIFPVLLSRQADGRWLRSELGERETIVEVVAALFYGLHNEPEKFKPIELESDEDLIQFTMSTQYNSEHDLHFGWDRFCKMDLNVQDESVTAKTIESLSCNNEAKAAITFYRSIWPIFSKGDLEGYLSLLSPMDRKSVEAFDFEKPEELKERLLYQATLQPAVSAVFSDKEYAFLFYTASDRGFKINKFQILWRNESGKYFLPSAEMIDVFTNFIRLPQVQNALIKHKVIRAL